MEYALFFQEGDDPQPYDPALDDIADWVARLEASGAAEYGERLRPAHDATTVRVRGGELLVTDGPFTEAKEAVGGFDLIDAPDLDAAIEIASRHPAARTGRVDVRPFFTWPDAPEGARVVPASFEPATPEGRLRYLMLVIATPTGEDGDDDPEAWVREMDGRGVRRFGDRLRKPADATYVARRGDEVIVSDGSFAEGKEWVAGLDLLEVSGLAEAVEVAAKHPMARGGALELWPLWPFDVHDDHVARTARERPETSARIEPPASAVLAELAGVLP